MLKTTNKTGIITGDQFFFNLNLDGLFMTVTICVPLLATGINLPMGEMKNP